MRNIYALLSLALIPMGCGPTDNTNPGTDTGNPDADADTDADGDTDADADTVDTSAFEAPIDAITTIGSATLVVTGAKMCEDLTCWVSEPGVYGSSLDAPDWLSVTIPADVKSADGVTVDFTEFGNSGPSINAVYTTDTGSTVTVVTSGGETSDVVIDLGLSTGTVPVGELNFDGVDQRKFHLFGNISLDLRTITYRQEYSNGTLFREGILTRW